MSENRRSNNIGEAIDRKFIINAESREHGTIYTEFQGVLFLAKDKAFLPTLKFYREECVRQGCEEDQVKAVDLMIGRVQDYQAAHPDELKIPDVEPGAKGADIIAPNKGGTTT